MKRVARIALRCALVVLPRDRREWGDALLAELAETRGGLESMRWALGGIRVIVFSPHGLARLAALGVVVGVVGGAFGNHEVFIVVRRGGFSSWLPALALALPIALAGLAAAWFVFRRSRFAVASAFAFLAVVVAGSVISLANVSPVRLFLDDWQQAVGADDPRVSHHAQELRWNAAVGALGAALVLLYAARRQAKRD